MKFSTHLSTLALAMTLGALSSLAQEPDTPAAYVQIHEVDLQTGMAADYARLLEEMEAALRDTNHPGFAVWEVIRGTRERFYTLRSAQNLAELEGKQLLREAWGEEKAAQFWKQMGEVVRRSQVSIWWMHPELGLPLPAEELWPQYSLVAFYTNSPGRQPEFRSHLGTNTRPAFEEAGVKGVYVGRQLIGGDPRRWMIARVFDDWAEIEDPRIAALGEEKYSEMLLKGGEMTDETEVLLLRYREDLSFRPEERPAGATSGSR